MATFAVSTFGRTYVTDEGVDQIPGIRIAFVVITIIFGLGIIAKCVQNYFCVLNPKEKSRLRYGRFLFFLHLLSYFIHAAHYADNIYRPVPYFEPKWLYVKYLISEMEITFYANFPISFAGLIGMKIMLESLSNPTKSHQMKKSLIYLIYYIIGSLLTLGHYRTEPPTAYSPVINFTIAGEGIATIAFAILIWRTWVKFGPSKNESDAGTGGEYQLVESVFENEDENESVSTSTKSSADRKTRKRTPVRLDK